ncbi:hypothetical protein At15955_46290 (plasmid) [Agrobacterium tumefaciens]|nr:hypothetical protein X971_4898 [Agrobacterium tumefaciens LBA4213 (Ach5)]AKC10466.1 hypothetical protein Ach5_46970 [Agrobacterium tumefaciens]AYM19614.1 hypothetical protein At15955_46290 [Agrobacterium tumefaciens]AYM70915.1 hypothetical protein AtA6_46990 [Agrobacterium tumefaciens]CUX05608.1 exported hypothetical protein [Agrobacterium fabacearum TT111]
MSNQGVKTSILLFLVLLLASPGKGYPQDSSLGIGRNGADVPGNKQFRIQNGQESRPFLLNGQSNFIPGDPMFSMPDTTISKQATWVSRFDFQGDWQGSFVILADPTLKAPALSSDNSVRRVLFKMPGGVDKFEVQPDVADDMIRKRAERLPPTERPPLDFLNAQGEALRQKTCGDAIRVLRSAPVMGLGLVPGDRIDFFEAACLFPSWQSPPVALSKAQLAQASVCSGAYQTFRQQCYGDQTTFGNSKAANNVGVLATEYLENAQARLQIICSGMLLSPTRILTAQHCLYGVKTGAAGQRKLLFFPYRTTNRAPSYDVISVQRAPDMRYETVAEAIAAIPRSGRLVTANDTMVLTLAAGQSLPDVEAVGLRPIAAIKRVQMPGFQRMIVNSMLMKARLLNLPMADDDDLLKTGDWREAFVTDQSPTCLAMPITIQEASAFAFDASINYGHTCQSLGTTSGAPLISFEETSVALVAVHIGGATVGGDSTPDVLIESYAPKNVAVRASDTMLRE